MYQQTPERHMKFVGLKLKNPLNFRETNENVCQRIK